MGQPRPQMIAGAVQENLGLIFQSSERARMDDAGTITLKFRPVGVAWLGVRPPARFSGFLSERREDASFVRLHLFPPPPALLSTRASWQIVRHGKEYSWAAAVCESELAVLSSDSLSSLYSHRAPSPMSRRPKPSAVRKNSITSSNRWSIFAVATFIAA